MRTLIRAAVNVKYENYATFVLFLTEQTQLDTKIVITPIYTEGGGEVSTNSSPYIVQSQLHLDFFAKNKYHFSCCQI